MLDSPNQSALTCGLWLFALTHRMHSMGIYIHNQLSAYMLRVNTQMEAKPSGSVHELPIGSILTIHSILHTHSAGQTIRDWPPKATRL
jgi:hypothetical protein